MSTEPNRTFYTAPSDCVLWTGKLLFAVVIPVAAAGWLFGKVRGTPVADPVALGLNILAFVLCASIVVGLLLFSFGWMGRVTLSAEGLKGPRYSGFHQFVPWSEIRKVEAGSLNGWPCAVVLSGGKRGPTYVMVIGRARAKLIECIQDLAPATNPLREFYVPSDAKQIARADA
jgi:hypothetical protein